MAFFSIVCPVYNCESTIEGCVDSILDQPFKDWELILVDDGSTDNSGFICEEYSRKYSFIRTIHQNNQGPYNARVNGIKIAKGKYLYFVDADDELIPNCFGKVYKKIATQDVDLLIVNVLVIDACGNEIIKFSRRKMKQMAKKPVYYTFVDSDLGWSCCKFLRRSLFNNVELGRTNVKNSEDCLLLSKIIWKVKSVKFLVDPCYKYIKTNSTLTTDRSGCQRYFDYAKVRQEFYEIYGISKRNRREFKRVTFQQTIQSMYFLKTKNFNLYSIDNNPFFIFGKFSYFRESFRFFVVPIKIFIKFLLLRNEYNYIKKQIVKAGNCK